MEQRKLEKHKIAHISVSLSLPPSSLSPESRFEAQQLNWGSILAMTCIHKSCQCSLSGTHDFTFIFYAYAQWHGSLWSTWGLSGKLVRGSQPPRKGCCCTILNTHTLHPGTWQTAQVTLSNAWEHTGKTMWKGTVSSIWLSASHGRAMLWLHSQGWRGILGWSLGDDVINVITSNCLCYRCI